MYDTTTVLSLVAGGGALGFLVKTLVERFVGQVSDQGAQLSCHAERLAVLETHYNKLEKDLDVAHERIRSLLGEQRR